jgi:uncharacterized protein YndB with AHSA1/START domain
MDETARTMVISRTINAPRALVFEAWSDPKHLGAWWGPDGFTTTTSAFDMRAGGVWRFVMHGPDGRDYENRITFEEIAMPERLVYRHGGGEDVEPVQFQTTVTFEERGAKTLLTMRALFPTAAELQRVVKEYGAEEGGRQNIGRLAAYVEKQVAGASPGEEFVITRIFDAPRDLVWAAHTQAERLKHWWGPKGFAMLSCKVDLRPGGLFHYGMRSPDGHEMWGKFLYREIVKPERLVFVVSFSDAKAGTTRHPMSASWPLEVLNTATFAEQGGKTVLTITGGPVNATKIERQTFAGAHKSMEMGFKGTLDQLDAYLAKLRAGH